MSVIDDAVTELTKLRHNDFGQLTADYQNHSAAVNVLTTPKVQYGYASGSDNTIRATTITYPDGRVITYDYGSTDSMADALSRVAAIVDDDMSSTHLADYSYLGCGSLPSPSGRGVGGEGVFVETDYTEPDIRYTLIGTAGGNDPDTGDIYRGLDRFGRIVDSYWYDYGSSADVDRIKYGYGRSGNRLWRENVVARSLGKYFDEKYLYDEIHRLKDMERGELASGQSSITNLQFAQCWGLDETGNWSNFREDDDGNGGWNLNQDRTANKVNEISDITESTGPSWVTPAYSKAGNMTTVPKPADPTTSFTATYDAWNRLTKLVDTTSSDTVAEYEYDGAKRRTIQKSYDTGTLDETRHLYYTEPSKWQVIEERVDSDTAPNRQFVWGLRYIDDLILRDRDTTGNGTLDERLYALQDANWNVTAITDTAGAVQQRFSYTAYGKPLFLDFDFTDATNSKGFETLYAGYRRDVGSGCFLIRNRVYHPSLAIWLSRDPLGISAGVNMYEYSDSGPINHTDSLGLLTSGTIIIILVFIIIVILGGTNCAIRRREERTVETINTCDCGSLCDFYDGLNGAAAVLQNLDTQCNNGGAPANTMVDLAQLLANNGVVTVGEHTYGVSGQGNQLPQCQQDLINNYFETDSFCVQNPDACNHPSSVQTNTVSGVCTWIAAEAQRLQIAANLIQDQIQNNGCQCA